MYQDAAFGYKVKLTASLHVLGPRFGRVRPSLDGVDAALAQVGQAVADPLHVLLDRHRHVAEHRRAARPGDGEQVREIRNRESEIRLGSRLPRIGQRLTGPAPADAGARDVSASKRWLTHRVQVVLAPVVLIPAGVFCLRSGARIVSSQCHVGRALRTAYSCSSGGRIPVPRETAAAEQSRRAVIRQDGQVNRVDRQESAAGLLARLAGRSARRGRFRREHRRLASPAHLKGG